MHNIVLFASTSPIAFAPPAPTGSSSKRSAQLATFATRELAALVALAKRDGPTLRGVEGDDGDDVIRRAALALAKAHWLLMDEAFPLAFWTETF